MEYFLHQIFCIFWTSFFNTKQFTFLRPILYAKNFFLQQNFCFLHQFGWHHGAPYIVLFLHQFFTPIFVHTFFTQKFYFLYNKIFGFLHQFLYHFLNQIVKKCCKNWCKKGYAGECHVFRNKYPNFYNILVVLVIEKIRNVEGERTNRAL